MKRNIADIRFWPVMNTYIWFIVNYRLLKALATLYYTFTKCLSLCMCVCLCVSEHGCVLVLQIYRERDSQRFVSKRERQIDRERGRERYFAGQGFSHN